MSNLPPMQLHMYVDAENVHRLPDIPLEEGYALRGYAPGDEERLLDLLHAAEFFQDADLDYLKDYLAKPERREGTRFVVRGEEIVAVTFASQRSLEPMVGGLDFVACHPDHRGKRFGRAVCTAVLKYLVDRGYGRVTLTTDDWRLPAIKTYLALGLVPEMCREDMPGRWRVIYEKLGGMRNAECGMRNAE